MVTLLKVVPSCFGLWIYFLFSFQLLYVPQLFNLPVVIWTQKINSMLICQNWLCFLLKYPAICFNLDAVSAVTGFVFIQKLYCPFSVLNLLKNIFPTCEIPERCSANFWRLGRGVWMAVLLHTGYRIVQCCEWQISSTPAALRSALWAFVQLSNCKQSFI